MVQTALKPPRSSLFNRGVLGGHDGGRSPEGRFLLRVEAELIAQLGREPSFSERMLLTQITRSALRIEKFDRRLAAGEDLTDREERLHAIICNGQRLALQALGLLRPTPARVSVKSQKPTMDTWREVMAELAEPYEEAQPEPTPEDSEAQKPT